MADSPGKKSDRILSCTVYSDGKDAGNLFRLSSAWVRLGLNRVGRATLKFDAGDMSWGTFEETDSETFKPGAGIELAVGSPGEEEVVFTGNVVMLNVRLEEGYRAQMVVECRDCVFAATRERRNRLFENQSDSDILSSVLSAYGPVEVEDTAYRHPSLVQYYCSDWDFALSRADANGLFIKVEGGKICVMKPKARAEAVLSVAYGVDLIDFNGGVSASGQFVNVEAVSWDLQQQSVVSVTAATPVLNDQGNIAVEEMGGEDRLLYQTDAPTESDALQAWVDGQALKTGLARFRGSFSFNGSAAVKPGCIVELNGMGERFDGKVFVGAVEHTIRNNTWVTRVEMGVPAVNITEEPNVVAPPASGWLPGIEGLHVGKVKQLDGDPLKEQRILVEIPLLNGDKNTVWARLAMGYAGNGRGYFFLPEAGDEVVIGFFNNDPCHPVVLGSMYSSGQGAPYELKAENNTKAIVTREKMKVEFDEEKKIVTVTTPGNNCVELNDEAKSVKLSDPNNNTLLLDEKGITLDSAGKIVLKAGSDIEVSATGKIALEAQTDVAVEGMNIEAKAKAGFKAKGNATAELSASGQTTVKGGMVLIN